MAPKAQLEPIHEAILHALNTFRVLTYDLMKQVGVARDQKSLGLAVNYLERTGLIGMNEEVIVNRKRGLPNLFWLTRKGATILHDIDQECGASGAERTSDDFHETVHRLGLVELHIALRAWARAAGIAVIEVVSEFDKGGHGRGKATTIDLPGSKIIPDLVAWLLLPGDDIPSPLLIEFERGGNRGDLSEFFSQDARRGKLHRLREASQARAVEHVYKQRNEPIRRPRFLVVFSTDPKFKSGEPKPLRRNALDRWPDPADRVWDWFFVKDHDEAKADFGGGWYQPGDRPQRPLVTNLAPPR